MADTLRATSQGLQIVAQRGRIKGWTKTRTPAWWIAAHTSQATLRRFWRRLPIHRDTFIAICQAVGISQWETIAEAETIRETDFSVEMENTTLTYPKTASVDLVPRRTLAAIVFTDAVAFSARMNANENQTLRLLQRDLGMMYQACEQFEGNVLKSTGDGLLMYFTSAIQAVACALEIQESLARTADNLSPQDCLSHRIGIHLGDVVFRDGDVMGNGVNIAARLQYEAEPGGICISQTVYDVVKNALTLKVNFLGPKELKNISEAVPVYQILLASQMARKKVVEEERMPTIEKSAGFQDWGEAPEVECFYGRMAELSQLEQWIGRDRCKLVTILGMGGIGKTTLTVTLADHIQEEFDFLIWRSLRNAPALETMLAELIPFLSNQQYPGLPDTLDRQLALLMSCLREHWCLIILDNAESILNAKEGDYAPGYESYGEFIRKISEERHESCLVVTSREQLPVMTQLLGQKVKTLQLRGLAQEHGQAIFHEIGSFSASEAEWQIIVDHYAGNPLALKIIAAAIRDLLDSNVASFLDYLNQGKFLFADIRDILDRQLNRLSELEKEVMYWLAIAREPMDLQELQSDLLSPESKRHLMDTLKSLKRRSMIEVTPSGLTQQPVIMEYMNSRLIDSVCEEIVSQNLNLFKTHALIKAQAKDYIRETQIRLILSPLLEQLMAIYGTSDLLKRQLVQLLEQLRFKLPVETGYAGGNILNLLCQIQADLNGLDFSNLTVWQAYLREATLHTVNFTNSDLSKAVFRETLGGILSVAFSPDGTIVATSDVRGRICLWHVADGRQILSLEGHNDFVFSIAFHPQGNMLASGGLDRTIRLWDLQTGECLQRLSIHKIGVSMVVFSPDGTLLASSSGDQTIKLSQVSTGECVMTLQGHHGIVRSIAFSPQGHLLVSAGLDHLIKVWDLKTGHCLKTIEDSCQVNSMTLIPELYSPHLSTDPGKDISGFHPVELQGLIVTAGEDAIIKLWNLNTGECVKTLAGHSERIWCVSCSPNGLYLATASDDTCIRLWETRTGQCIKTFAGHENRVWFVAFSPDSHLLVSGSEDQRIKLWDINSGQCCRTIQGYHNGTQPFAFDRSGKHLYTFRYADQSVKLWETQSGDCLKTLHLCAKGVMQVTLNPAGDMIAGGGLDRLVRLWDAATGECLLTLRGHTAWVRVVAFNNNGEILASGGGDQTIKLWNIQTGKCLKTLAGHTHPIQSLAFSSDGQILASGSWDTTIKLWNVKTGKCLKTLSGHTNRVGTLAFSPVHDPSSDSVGELLVSGSHDQTVKFWELTTGHCVATLHPDIGEVVSVAFSADGQILASGGRDIHIKLWDVLQGFSTMTLSGSSGEVGMVVFSLDGQQLASGGEDGINRLWDLKTGRCLKTFKIPRPYEGMNITNLRGLTEVTLSTLKTLGAIEV
jgi:WD40 repeat protein/class 3 adenylate cyclase